jgi:hypothetical protein
MILNEHTRSLGKAFGKPVTLYSPERRSLSDPVGNCILLWGDDRITLDTGSMQPKLVRLMPRAYAGSSAKQWEPFITLALATGLFEQKPVMSLGDTVDVYLENGEFYHFTVVKDKTKQFVSHLLGDFK